MKCVYCLKSFSATDEGFRQETEHVFPKSWYSDATPSSTQAITVPAHRCCNQALQKVEDELRIRLALVTRDDIRGAQGIRNKAIRAVSPNCGKSDKDSDCRSKLLSTVLNDINPDTDFIDRLAPNSQVKVTKGVKYPSINTRAEAVFIFLHKLIRGFTFSLTKKLIYDSHRIESFVVDDSADYFRTIKENLRLFKAETIDLGPSLRAYRYPSLEDDVSGLFTFHVWDHFSFAGTVTRSVDYRGDEDPGCADKISLPRWLEETRNLK